MYTDHRFLAYNGTFLYHPSLEGKNYSMYEKWPINKVFTIYRKINIYFFSASDLHPYVCFSITVMLHQSWVKDWKQHNQHNADAAGSNQA